MSDQIKHECGIALLRLLKPMAYYQKKYGTPLYGLNKMYLLMQKQVNRGQDGAGLVNIKLDPFLETADVDMNNNYWPPRNEPTRFQLFKQNESRKENLMQRDLRSTEMENKTSE